MRLLLTYILSLLSTSISAQSPQSNSCHPCPVRSLGNPCKDSAISLKKQTNLAMSTKNRRYIL